MFLKLKPFLKQSEQRLQDCVKNNLKKPHIILYISLINPIHQ